MDYIILRTISIKWFNNFLLIPSDAYELGSLGYTYKLTAVMQMTHWCQLMPVYIG